MGSHAYSVIERQMVDNILSDNTNHFMRVFDATVMPPALKTSVKLRDEPGWISWSLDGKTAYPSTGDVIDVASKKVVAQLTPSSGHNAREYWAVYGCVRMLTAAVVAVSDTPQNLYRRREPPLSRDCSTVASCSTLVSLGAVARQSRNR